MATFTNQTKHTSVFKDIIAHGKATLLADIQDMKFTDVFFADGTQLKDVTFAQLVDTAYSLQVKHTAAYTNQSKH
jgi:hypothetical protein